MAKKLNAKSSTSKSNSTQNIKLRESDKVIEQVKSKFDSLSESNKLKLLTELGVGEDYFTCDVCSKVQHKQNFYVSTDPIIKSGITHTCRDCASEIVSPTVNGVQQPPTRETVNEVLLYLDKPFLDSVWEGSLLEASNVASNKKRNNVWSYYIKNIQMPNYYTKRYRDSDGYKSGLTVEKPVLYSDDVMHTEMMEQFEKNKKDVIRLIGYLPFEKENIVDQPYLYSQLIGFLDASEEGNDDMMRTQSIISIIRGFAQESQIDDMIAKLSSDLENAERNIATCKALQAMKRDISLTITKLAESSCISLKHSRNAKKGENTWTGKIKKIQDLNLREGEINGFDLATCKGMRQVMDMSNESILKQLRLDESEWSDMVAEMRETIVSLRRDKDNYQEVTRILLRENLDLKDILSTNNLLDEENIVDLKDLFSTFSDIEEYDSEDEDVINEDGDSNE